jgi:tetratricopeptide (TPR) repeat protein
MTREPRRLIFSLPSLAPYLSREPVMLAVLTGLTIVLFLAVGGLSRLYHAQLASLAVRWAGRGVDDLNAGHYKVAITEFRTALLYDRDNGAYQLSLAQALLGLGKPDSTDSAYAYLINLWSREPENGVVNLELARIAVGKKETDRALRFYHNAIYATWPGNQETERRKARLELIDYLLRTNARTQAESELIALEANAGDDAAQQTLLGDLFLRVGDNGRALTAFQASLKLERRNPAAEAGAGRAEFAMGRYADAQRSLQAAVAAAPADNASAELLRTAQAAIRMDPFRPQIPDRERDQIVMDAFATAGERLKTCETNAAAIAAPGKKPAAGTPNTAWRQFSSQWSALQPQVTANSLRQNPDLVNTAMNLAFAIEREAVGACGPATGADQALLLVAGQNEEN